MSLFLTSLLSSLVLGPSTLEPLIGSSQKMQLERSFNHFMVKFSKNYEPGTPEYITRLTHYKNTLERIERLNEKRIHSHSSAFYGVTPFSDLSPQEFKAKYLRATTRTRKRHVARKYGDGHSGEVLEQNSRMYQGEEQRNKRSLFTFGNNFFYGPLVTRSSNLKAEEYRRSILNKYWNLKNVPQKVDWRDKKVISGVKNQQKCGACWAYSTIETIESMVAIRTLENKSSEIEFLNSGPEVLELEEPSSNFQMKELSVQQIVDCSGSDPSSGNHGCDGGDTCSALNWMAATNVKILTESEYPLRDDSGYCRQPNPEHGIQIHNYTCEYLVHNEEEMIRQLANHGPLTVAVDATSWQDYLGGVIQFHCESTRNHAVQIVGYDLTGQVPYFIVRNTWGKDFGIDGYLHIAIGKNMCGIAEEVSWVHV